jgi:hypothetical protein
VNSHLFLTVDGQQIRKGSRSGSDGGGQDSGGNCVYLNSPDTAQPFAYDSKADKKLTFGTKARRGLVAALSAGTFAVLGILAMSGDNTMTHDCMASVAPDMTHNCRAFNW